MDAGETLGILGPNGAGKTTLFNLISRRRARATPAASSTTAATSPRCRRTSAAALGIGRTYQVPQPFGHMTVFENLVDRGLLRRRPARARGLAHRAARCCEQTGLLRACQPAAPAASRCSNRKRLELARALATRPKLLLLDEIAGGLTEHEARELVDELKRIKAQGVTMVWIEHVVHALLAIADRLFVINFGQQAGRGRAAGGDGEPRGAARVHGHGGMTASDGR